MCCKFKEEFVMWSCIEIFAIQEILRAKQIIFIKLSMNKEISHNFHKLIWPTHSFPMPSHIPFPLVLHSRDRKGFKDLLREFFFIVFAVCNVVIEIELGLTIWICRGFPESQFPKSVSETNVIQKVFEVLRNPKWRRRSHCIRNVSENVWITILSRYQIRQHNKWLRYDWDRIQRRSMQTNSPLRDLVLKWPNFDALGLYQTKTNILTKADTFQMFSETIPPKRGKKREKTFINEVLTYEKNHAKWTAAKKFCEENNMKFIVLTEYELDIK